MTKRVFRRLVKEALVNLPKKYQEKLENLAIVVEDWPTKKQLESFNLPQGVFLFGLYQGVPKTKRGQGYTMVSPDKITIFQKVIESFCPTKKKIKAQIRATVLHEIGHHFGLSEEELSGKTS